MRPVLQPLHQLRCPTLDSLQGIPDPLPLRSRLPGAPTPLRARSPRPHVCDQLTARPSLAARPAPPSLLSSPLLSSPFPSLPPSPPRRAVRAAARPDSVAGAAPALSRPRSAEPPAPPRSARPPRGGGAPAGPAPLSAGRATAAPPENSAARRPAPPQYMDYLTMSECIQLSFAVCRIGIYTCFRALCCKGPPPPRPEYDLVCIGLSGSGKTSLLSQLCSESLENIVSTTGFSIKAVPFQNAILNVKELGGADNIRKYWSRYYQGSQGVIFVLDSASSEDDLETARNELHSALQHPQLCTLPFLILANHQDKPAARSVQEIKKYFELEPLARGKRWILKPCSLDDMEAVKDSFSLLINLLEERDFEPSRM
ncbi:ADP-ribosylation factor-like protein 15 isoform X2 [Manacus candei]|nr:ADP-ribosylation factor-like protein 15 isoform X2 [Manacus candei]